MKTISTSLNIGSYNLRVPCDPPPNDWASRAPRVKRTLASLDFHIFGVQETVPEQLESLTQTGRYRAAGHGRNADHTGESSSILYDTRRLELLRESTFWLSETPDVFSLSWGSTIPRIATVGIFRDVLTDKTFVFANTHLHHERKYLCQRSQLLVIMERLKPYLLRGMPVILTGDFNATPQRPAPVLASTWLRNARNISQTTPQGPTAYSYHGYAPEDSLDWSDPDIELIDYIFVSFGITVLAYANVDDFDEHGLASSDHFPQKAVITLP